MTQTIATILASLIAAFAGSWFGALQALSRFKRERAFDRQLDWYERTMRALHDFAQRIEVALTFDRDPSTEPAKLTHLWSRVQVGHLALETVALEAPLYASPEAVRKTKALLKSVQAVADEDRGVRSSSVSAGRRSPTF